LTFKASRTNGLSDREVVFHLVANQEPGTIITFEQLFAALSDGLDIEMSKSRIYNAIAAVKRDLRTKKKRNLVIERNIGYKIISPEQHLYLAHVKKDKAEDYLIESHEVLKHTNKEELSEKHRKLHENEMILIGGLIQAVRASEERHIKQESAIDKLKTQQAEILKRLERLEG
jgi:hypothetical protein